MLGHVRLDATSCQQCLRGCSREREIACNQLASLPASMWHAYGKCEFGHNYLGVGAPRFSKKMGGTGGPFLEVAG